MAVASAATAADGTSDDQTNAATVQSVVVSAPREEVVARAKQRDAATIIDVQSAETIAKYPDYNAAEAMGRIPGVSLSTDTGEGRFVNIRGIDANLNGATYGGVVLLNTNTFGTAASGGGRAVEFDTIPTGAIDGIVLYKTLSPDREAEGLGGQIELTPRSAKNISKPFLEGDLGWGYENLHGHTGPFTASAAAGVRFGFNNGKLVVEGDNQDQSVAAGWISNPTPFSLVITASRKDDRRGIDDIEVGGYLNDGSVGAKDTVIAEEDFRRYDYHRRRFGYGMEFDFKPNEDHSYFLRANVAGYIEHAHKNHFYIFTDGNPTQVGNVVSDGFQPAVFTADYDETHRNTVISAGGSDRFNKLTLDYRVAYSRATFLENHYTQSLWTGADAYYVAYNNISNPDHPQFSLFTDAAHTTPFNPNNASLYSNPSLGRYYESDHDEEYSYAVNGSYPVDLIGKDGVAKVGVSARMREKVVNDNSASGSATANLSNYASNSGQSDYYNGWYASGPYADIYGIRNLANANLSPLAPYLKRDFDDNENVYGGYAMYTTHFDKLTVLTGLRVEATDDTFRNWEKVTTSAGNSLAYVSASKSYTNLFPTVQLKYEYLPNLQFRVTWSTGIARPGFTQAGGYAAANFATQPASVTRGNPDLKPTTGNNFDLDAEYYLPSGGVIEFGLFDKEFDNYITAHTSRNVHDPLLIDPVLNPTGTGTVTSFTNESGYARGIEAAYHQKFVWLAKPFDGLGLEANFTAVDSRFLEYDATVSGTGANEYGSLPGTSHITYNVAVFYEEGPLELRLSTEYVGKSLFGLGGDKTLDVIQDKKQNWDFTSSYRFTHNLTGYFNVKNLSDAPLRYYEGEAYRPIQREFYGQTYEFGLRAKF